MSDEHLAGRGLALGVVGGAMHGPAAVGGGVSNQGQQKIESHEVLIGGRSHGRLAVRVDADRPHGLSFYSESARQPQGVAVLSRVDVRTLIERLGSWLVRGTLGDPQMDAAEVWRRSMGIVSESPTGVAGTRPGRAGEGDGKEKAVEREPECDCGKFEHGRHHSACPVEVHKRRMRSGDVDRAGMPPVIAEQAEGIGDNDSWVEPDEASDAVPEEDGRHWVSSRRPSRAVRVECIAVDVVCAMVRSDLASRMFSHVYKMDPSLTDEEIEERVDVRLSDHAVKLAERLVDRLDSRLSLSSPSGDEVKEEQVGGGDAH